MDEGPETNLRIHRSDPFNLLIRTRQIHLGSVLHQQHEITLRDSFRGRLDVRLQNLFGRHAIVVEEAIRRLHFGAAICPRGNAEIRIGSESFHESSQKFIETLVAQVNAVDFIFKSHRCGILQCDCHVEQPP